MVQRLSTGHAEAVQHGYTIGSTEKFVGCGPNVRRITYPGRFTRILIKKIQTVLTDDVFLESKIQIKETHLVCI